MTIQISLFKPGGGEFDPDELTWLTGIPEKSGWVFVRPSANLERIHVSYYDAKAQYWLSLQDDDTIQGEMKAYWAPITTDFVHILDYKRDI